MSKAKILTIAAAIFTLAAGLGSTFLTPAQREAILQFLTVIL